MTKQWHPKDSSLTEIRNSRNNVGLAPPRRRPKRIAKRIAKRNGYWSYRLRRGFAAVFLRSSRGIGEAIGEALNRAVAKRLEVKS